VEAQAMKRIIVAAALSLVVAAGGVSAALVSGQDAGKSAPSSTSAALGAVGIPPVGAKGLGATNGLVAPSPSGGPAVVVTPTVPAKIKAPAVTSTVTPPVLPPPVDIPPIPEVDKDPFKAGPAPVRKAAPDVLEEGKRLFNREGRIEKDPKGHIVFVFDSGDKPMRLLENSWREYMETQTDSATKQARWRVSGIVMVYQGENFLLLTKSVHMMAEEESM
jgi:hypothetical protein